jgi:ATP-dependent DNA helicase RecQ
VWEYFASSGIPVPEHVEAVLGALTAGVATVPAIESATKLRRGRVEALLKLLAVDGVVARGVDGWASTGRPWTYDAAKWLALRRVRNAEADLMRRYAAGDGCLMQFLQEALDDPDPSPCGRCSVCTGELPFPGASAGSTSTEATLRYLRTLDVELEPRKLWPSGLPGRKGKITACATGRALAFADDAAWSDAIATLDGVDVPVSAEIADAVVAVLGRWRRSWERPVAVVPMPSRRRAQLIRSLAEHLATVGKLPLIDALEVAGPRPPTDVASAARATALLGSMRVADGVRLPAGPALLVDDTYRTGWTATVAASLITEAGATTVLPLVIHKLP